MTRRHWLDLGPSLLIGVRPVSGCTVLGRYVLPGEPDRDPSRPKSGQVAHSGHGHGQLGHAPVASRGPMQGVWGI